MRLSTGLPLTSAQTLLLRLSPDRVVWKHLLSGYRPQYLNVEQTPAWPAGSITACLRGSRVLPCPTRSVCNSTPKCQLHSYRATQRCSICRAPMASQWRGRLHIYTLQSIRDDGKWDFSLLLPASWAAKMSLHSHSITYIVEQQWFVHACMAERCIRAKLRLLWGFTCLVHCEAR